MKKFLTILLAVLMVLCLAGCAKEEAPVADEEDPEVTAKGVYFITNNTGANVGAVYVYPVGGSRGTNYVHAAYEAGEMHYDYLQNFHGIKIDAEDDAMFAEWTGKKSETPHFVLEFCDEDGELIGTFGNLALEEATIVLISEDMRTGDTQIAWNDIDYTMTVKFYNHTGSTVTSLKAYDDATGEEVDDILATCGVESIADKNEEPVVWTHTEKASVANTRHYDIVWETEDGQKLSLTAEGYNSHALSFENTDMVLRNADTCAGATTVWWILGMAQD